MVDERRRTHVFFAGTGPSIVRSFARFYKFHQVAFSISTKDTKMAKIIGFMIVFAGLSTALMANQTVPEIDSSTGSSAIALIGGVLLAIGGRRSK
jgi:hypothetical protein